MAHLSGAQRRRLPLSHFADAEHRAYPILDQADLALVARQLVSATAPSAIRHRAVRSRAVLIARRMGLMIPASLLSPEVQRGRRLLERTLRKPGAIAPERTHALEAAMATGLMLIYLGERADALARLGRRHAPPFLASRYRIGAFAAQRAHLVESGTNSRLDAARTTPGKTAAAAQQAITRHNVERLVPFLVAWATQQATLDAERETIGDRRQRASSTRLWIWTQNTDFEDDCTAADAASPAPLDDLIGIAGGEPPIHINCQCTLMPADEE